MSQRDDRVYVGHMLDTANKAIATALPQLKGQLILEGDSGLGKTMFVRHLLKQSRKSCMATKSKIPNSYKA